MCKSVCVRCVNVPVGSICVWVCGVCIVWGMYVGGCLCTFTPTKSYGSSHEDLWKIMFFVFFFKDFIYLFMRDTERD